MKWFGILMMLMGISGLILFHSITPEIDSTTTTTSTNTAMSTLLPTKILQPIPTAVPTAESLVGLYYHKQMDYGEYEGYFLPLVKTYFGNADIRKNFCGVMTLLNVLDIMSERRNGSPYGMTAVEMVNKYFVNDYGEIAFTYKHGDPSLNPNGSMNFTAMYWLADKIGKDTNLWEMKLIHGSNNSTYHEPIKKSDLSYWVEIAKKEVFDKGGIVIMDIGRNKGSDQIAYLHFITVLDMVANADGSAQMLIVDSMGTDHNGFYGWVNSEEYTTYGLKEYTGILNIYGVIPIGEK